MHNYRKAFFLLLLLVSFPRAICEGSWMLEGHIWSSPHHEQQLCLGQLSRIWQPHEHVKTVLSLPVQYTCGPGAQGLEYLYPRFALVASVPFNDMTQGLFRFDFSLRPQVFKLQGGFQMLHDPMALKCAFSYEGRSLELDGSVVFAVNERWALGAHLHYARNSLLTFEIHHTSARGKQRQFSYSHSLDGSLQALGFKVAL